MRAGTAPAFCRAAPPEGPLPPLRGTGAGRCWPVDGGTRLPASTCVLASRRGIGLAPPCGAWAAGSFAASPGECAATAAPSSRSTNDAFNAHSNFTIWSKLTTPGLLSISATRAWPTPSSQEALAKFDMEPYYMSSADYRRYAEETIKAERNIIYKLGLEKK